MQFATSPIDYDKLIVETLLAWQHTPGDSVDLWVSRAFATSKGKADPTRLRKLFEQNCYLPQEKSVDTHK